MQIARPAHRVTPARPVTLSGEPAQAARAATRTEPDLQAIGATSLPDAELAGTEPARYAGHLTMHAQNDLIWAPEPIGTDVRAAAPPVLVSSTPGALQRSVTMRSTASGPCQRRILPADSNGRRAAPTGSAGHPDYPGSGLGLCVVFSR